MPQSTILSPATQQEIDHWLTCFPPQHKRSAVIAALRAAQHQNGGWLSKELIDAVAHYLELAAIQVHEVARFYSMFECQPVGRHCLSICTNISCMLRGADALLAHAEKRLGIRCGQSSNQPNCYLKQEEECLAACCDAPVIQLDHHYHNNMTPAKLDALLQKLK